ncbi:hypothetical protein, partial [Ruminococcus sp.]|uniref:hypothetical protein n=1 Tax=Ruminococcus sp. TaxID=41978 RepID=UPI00262CEA22
AVPQFYYTRSAFHRRVAAFLARFTAFLVACWRFPSGDSLLSGARNNHQVSKLAHSSFSEGYMLSVRFYICS